MREKIYILLIGIFIGIVFGYGWRMIQVEPIFDDQVKIINQNLKRLNKDLYNIELRMTLVEDKIHGLNKKIRIERRK